MKISLKKSGMILALALCSPAYGQDYYVDVKATSPGTGSEAEPFQGLSTAITEAYRVKNGSDTIFLRAGRYQVPVIINDIGDANNPIIITPFNDEQVIIDGSKSIAEIGGLNWEKLASDDNIYKTVISEDIWQLWIDDKMAVVARWPNVTVGHPTDKVQLKADGRTPVDGSWWDLNGTWAHMNEGWSESDLSDPSATMVNDSNYHDLAALGKSVAGGSVILNFHSETQFSRNITGHVAGSNNFIYDKVKRPFDKGKGHYMIEHKNALDMPGEWYYDQDSQEVWLWPEDGLDPTGRNIRGKTSTYAFDLVNAKFITFKGLTFFGTTISCKECNNITIAGNKFLYPSWHDRMLGKHRIVDDTKKKDSEGYNVTAFAPGRGDTLFYGSNYRINDNEFAYSDAAIEMNRSRDAGNASPENNQVENNLFHHFSFTGMAHSMLQMNANKGDSWQKNNTFHTHGSRAIAKVAYVNVSMSRAYQWGYFQQDGVAWQAAGGNGTGGGSDGTIRHHLWVHDALKPAVRWDGFDGINGLDHHIVAVNTPGFAMIKGDYHQVYNNVGVLPHDPNDTMFKILNTNEGWGGKPLAPRNENSLVKNNLSASISGARSGYEALNALDENNWNGFLKNTLAAEQLRDPKNFDFRPKASSVEVIDQGQVIAGITDDVSDGRPDIGAYEHGATSYWIPGFRYANKATSPVPRLATRSAKIDADLMWLKANNIVQEQLYFGTSPDNMTMRAIFSGDNNIYDPGTLIPHQTYYWRIDTKTVNSGSDFVTGDTWSFTVEQPLALTKQTIVVTEDVHVESAKPNTNLEGAARLKIHTTDLGVVDKLAYLKFTIPTVAHSELQKVTLRLHRGHSSATKGAQIYLLPDSLWQASTMTWDTRPADIGTLLNTVDISANSWQDIDVTAYVAEGEVSFALGRAANTNNRDVDAAESAFAPELVVVHREIDPTAPPTPPQAFTAVNEFKGNRLSWQAVDNAVAYNVYRRINPEDFFVTPLNANPITELEFFDDSAALNSTYQYVVKAVGDNGLESFDSNLTIITLVDIDDDGMADSWENYYGLDPLVDDSAGDFDNDGKTNIAEYLADSDPSVDEVNPDDGNPDDGNPDDGSPEEGNQDSEEPAESSGGAINFYLMMLAIFVLPLRRVRKQYLALNR